MQYNVVCTPFARVQGWRREWSGDEVEPQQADHELVAAASAGRCDRRTNLFF